jgi:hypothetical protein
MGWLPGLWGWMIFLLFCGGLGGGRGGCGCATCGSGDGGFASGEAFFLVVLESRSRAFRSLPSAALSDQRGNYTIPPSGSYQASPETTLCLVTREQVPLGRVPLASTPCGSRKPLRGPFECRSLRSLANGPYPPRFASTLEGEGRSKAMSKAGLSPCSSKE